MAQLDAASGIEQALRYLAKGDAVQALRALDRVSWVDLGWPDYWRVRAEAFLMLGEARQAAKCAGEGLLEDPDNLELLVLHVRALLQGGEYQRAQDALNHALLVAPDNLELQSLADALESQPPHPAAPAKTVLTPPHRDSSPIKNSRWGKPPFTEAEARAIQRAFAGNSRAYPSVGKSKAPARRRWWGLLFPLMAMGLVAYWLWPQVVR
ncbi:MAG: tetratricopeptide repeat protein [Meiothermus ruber]|jgi:tetratricopeptide (TPR) repeat protein|uniref:Tetratricopeptide repeat protein n=1 Tax=Meiothermus ruber TaxID=277 RepID=A0A7C3HSI1_MEIRU